MCRFPRDSGNHFHANTHLDADKWPDLPDALPGWEYDEAGTTFFNRIVTAWRRCTDSAGDIKFILGVTYHYAGDNYQVRIGFTKASIDDDVPENQKTCVLTAWKRYYYELDRMERPKGFTPLVDTGFAADEDHDPDVISVPKDAMSGFAVDDAVTVFDFETNAGESATITGIDSENGYIQLDTDLHDSYGTGQKGGGIKTNATNGYYEAGMSQWTTALSDAFIECSPAEGGQGTVPFRAFWSDAQMEQYVLDHFDNRLTDFHFWVCGAALRNYGNDTYGYSLQDSQDLPQQYKLNGSFVFRRSIERDEDTSGDISHWTVLISSHEGCHNGARPQLDDCTHQTNVTGDGKWCLMYQPYGSANIGFHHHGEHLWQLRDSDIP